VDGNAFLASASLECGGLLWREFDSFYVREKRAISGEGCHAGLGGSALSRSTENFARWRERQSLKDMSAEREEDITQEKDAGGAIANSVMRGEDEGALRLLMEQDGAKERSLTGSERCIYLFGDLPLPPGKGRGNHAKGNTLTVGAAKVRDAVESGVNAGREQGVPLLQCGKRVTPLLDSCVAFDLCCECTVGWKVLVEEAKQLFKSA
jgi:hypothetical protein